MRGARRGFMKVGLCLRFAILVAAFFCLGGCTGLGGPTDAPVTGTISGTVLDGRTGKPLAGAALSTNPVGQAVVSDAEGGFSISNYPSGTYTVTATKESYSSVTRD